MESRLYKTVQGDKMEAIFDAEHEEMSIRYFNTDIKEDEYRPDKSYKYEIVIRHNEGTDANELFDEAVAKLK